MHLLAIAAGFALLFGGGEMLVRGAVALAHRFGLSPVLIGATVVGFGTSAPELAVAIDASLTGHGSVALGTVIGSNLCNLLLILPTAALILPVRWSPRAIRRDALTLAIATALFVGLAATGRIGRLDGALLLAALAGLSAFAIARDRREPSVAVELLSEEAAAIEKRRIGAGVATALALAGICAVVAGAELLVSGATAIARRAGLSEAVIGLTLVAVGTSLPELAASAVAARRQHSEVALGNVLGSNVFNQLGIVGAAAAVAPLDVPPELARGELWTMAAAMGLFAASLLVFERLGRAGAAVLLAIYAVWVTLQVAPG